MKLFTASEIRTIDEATVKHQSITSLELMERAASAVACEIMERWPSSQHFIVFAGPGNNGGDALAVSRLLIDQGYRPDVILMNTGGHLSIDCAANRQRLIDMQYPQFTEVTQKFTMPEMSDSDVVIDGLFGIGLSQNLQGGYTVLARTISESDAYIVSIDLPSGLYPEYNSRNVLSYVMQADLTLTFQVPKLAFFFRETQNCIGDWKVLDIGLSRKAMNETPSNLYMIDRKGVKEGLRPRDIFSDKNDFGRMTLVAGGLGMTGASILAARAAMRTGVGVVKVHAPQCCYIPLQTAVPEAIMEQDSNACHLSEVAFDKRYTYALGPGLGTHPQTKNAIGEFLRSATSPLVLDADALNCIADDRKLLSNIPANSVITPHVGEFERLFGQYYTDEERFVRALEMSRFLKIVIVLKGHYTFVFRPDGKVFINTTGNPGMATAGSGDVLTGIISALMAQKYRPDMAASMGVYIHAYAGELAAKRHGEYGMTASDIVDNIGIAIKEIMEK